MSEESEYDPGKETTDQPNSDWEKNDPLMQLAGSGKHIWADEHADEYVRGLREGWD